MPDSILAIRIHAGFNVLSFTAGLLALTEQTSGTAGAHLRSLPGFPEDIGLELKPPGCAASAGGRAFLTPAEKTGDDARPASRRHPGHLRREPPSRRAPGSVPELFGTNSCAPKLECTALRRFQFTSMKSNANNT